MLKVEQLQKGLKKQIILNNITFEIKEGEIFSLFGHNASGKSTLLKILSGIMKPDSGNIFLNGKDIHKNNKVKKDICAVFQENIVPSGFKTIDFLLFYSKIVKSPYRKKDIISLAESYGIKNEDMKKKITHLSGGTKKKIEFLKSIINKDALFHLFDEPTIGFDPESQKMAWDHIRSLKKEKKIILLVTNMRNELNELADTKKIITDGKIKDFREGKTMKILKFTVKNWKKEIKEKIEKIEGVEKVVVKTELDKIKNDIQQKFGNANIKVVDLSNTDISVDDVLEKLGIEKTQVATMENKELKHVIEVYTNDNIETVQNDVLKTFVEYKVQILSMEVN